MKKLSHIGEFALIDLLKKQIGSVKAIEGIGDDAAVLPYTKNKYLLLTTDMLVEGTHFTKAMNFEAIGYKSMACNVSDIVAMGGLPKYAVVSLGVPGRTALKDIQQLYKGMKRCARTFGVDIVGGDTVKSDKIVLNIALTGEVFKNHLITRSGARIEDKIFVTGRLGNSFSSRWHLKFVPRMAQSQFLVKYFNPTSMIDISDGLAADLGHILERSKRGAVIE